MHFDKSQCCTIQAINSYSHPVREGLEDGNHADLDGSQYDGVNKLKLHLFDLLWICCTTSFRTCRKLWICCGFCCGFVVQLVVKQILNKSTKWSLSYTPQCSTFVPLFEFVQVSSISQCRFASLKHSASGIFEARSATPTSNPQQRVNFSLLGNWRWGASMSTVSSGKTTSQVYI
jgi:hypothetical protein